GTATRLLPDRAVPLVARHPRPRPAAPLHDAEPDEPGGGRGVVRRAARAAPGRIARGDRPRPGRGQERDDATARVQHHGQRGSLGPAADHHEHLRRAHAYPPASSTGLACSMMLAPLQTSAGVVGAAAVIRYRKPGGDAPPPFSLAELHYCTAVAAHIASGMELAQAVQSSREAAPRAAAMGNGGP